MITYLCIAAVFLFLGTVFLAAVASLEDWGVMLLLCIFWPISLFVGTAVFLGEWIRKHI